MLLLSAVTVLVCATAVKIPELDSFMDTTRYGESPYHPYLDDTIVSTTKLWFNVQLLEVTRTMKIGQLWRL
jgi:hypothetical protein